MTYEEAKKRRLEASTAMEATIEDMSILADESARVAGVLGNAEKILTEFDAEFEKKTGLTRVDTAFLFTAIGLQIARQYLVTDFKERPNDKTAADKTRGHTEEHSDRTGFKYNPPLSEVISNPVPFDAMFGGKNMGLNIGGGFGHRAKTLGHDPILGWIFGTANIATSTLTAWDFSSYHIETGYTSNGQRRDKIVGKANTIEMLGHVVNKLSANEGRFEKPSAIKSQVVSYI